MYMTNFLIDHWPHIISVVIMLFTFIIIFNILGVNFSPIKNTHVEKVVTIEGFDTHPTLETVPNNNYNTQQKHEICKDLSSSACTNASFCTLLNGEKCVIGSKHGPTYLTEDGNKVDFNYYYHKGKCYGKCPSG
jgi:hypothetical protein